jgi:hypothetical protein
MDTDEGKTVAKRVITAPRGKRPINVWVTTEERKQIERRAGATSLPVSVYLRKLGLGFEPKSTLDAERVGDLMKACGDLGRLGGLLKLWLAERAGEGAPEADVRALLHSIGELRDQIVERVAAV